MVTHKLRHYVRFLRNTPLHPQWLLKERRHVEEWIAKKPSRVLLDIRCADRWLEALLSNDCYYIGLDYLETGRRLYGARPDLFADASNLPIADSSIDAVALLEVLEHLENPRDALREIARVLEPGGRLLVTVPFLYPIHDAPYDYQRFTRHGLEREMKATGLRLEGIETTLGAAESAGLIANLALGGMAVEAISRRSPAVLFLPLIVIAMPAMNLLAWISNRLLPSWPALTSGYILMARKP